MLLYSILGILFFMAFSSSIFTFCISSFTVSRLKTLVPMSFQPVS